MSEDDLTRRLREAGLNLTVSRRAVMALLQKRRSEHLSAEEIHGALSAEGVTVNLSSVYRTVNLLVSLGLVHRMDLSESHTHFGVEHGEQAHLRCEVCGEVSEVYLSRDEDLAQRLQEVVRKGSFELIRFRVEAEGRCKRCALQPQRD
jgi:Fe2+ or Zn2+ uptake regulation protein